MFPYESFHFERKEEKKREQKSEDGELEREDIERMHKVERRNRDGDTG